MKNHLTEEFVTQTEFTAVMHAIKQDLDRIEDRMATKEDLRELETRLVGIMVTKDDLRAFATKEDLKAFATREDLKGFATKEDLATVKKDLATVQQVTLQILAIVTTLKA